MMKQKTTEKQESEKIGDDIRQKHDITNLKPKRANYRVNVQRLKTSPKKQKSFRIHSEKDIEELKKIYETFIKNHRSEIFDTSIIFRKETKKKKTHQIQIKNLRSEEVETKTFGICVEAYDYEEILQVLKEFSYDKKITMNTDEND